MGKGIPEGSHDGIAKPCYSIDGGPFPHHAARERVDQGGGWYNRRVTTLDQLRHFRRHHQKGNGHLLIVTARAQEWRGGALAHPIVCFYISLYLPSWGLDSYFLAISCTPIYPVPVIARLQIVYI